MLVTIITDASFCPKTKAAGYGFWIVCGRGKRHGGGHFKTPVSDIGVAEFAAMINALSIAKRLGLVRPQDTVLFQTDSSEALFQVRRELHLARKGKVPPVTPRWEIYLNEMARLTKDITVRSKHVKGHTNSDEPRFYVNRFCDAEAKRHMRRMRDAQTLAKGLKST